MFGYGSRIVQYNSKDRICEFLSWSESINLHVGSYTITRGREELRLGLKIFKKRRSVVTKLIRVF